MLTPEQARHCIETLEDVFTPEGDAVVIASMSVTGDASWRVVVSGERHEGEVFDLSELWLSHHSQAPGEKDLHPFGLGHELMARRRDNGTWGIYHLRAELWVVHPNGSALPYEFEDQADATEVAEDMNRAIVGRQS